MRIAFIQFTIFFFAISLLFLFYLSYIQKISIDFNASKNKFQIFGHFGSQIKYIMFAGFA